MRVRVLAFARVREVLGSHELDLDLAEGSTIEDAWSALAQRASGLALYRDSTRLACNGRIAAADHALRDGDEVALLPPAGGG